jgi:hypothetical protein
MGNRVTSIAWKVNDKSGEAITQYKTTAYVGGMILYGYSNLQMLTPSSITTLITSRIRSVAECNLHTVRVDFEGFGVYFQRIVRLEL